VRPWISRDRRCFAACVGAILNLGPEAEERLAALPASFSYEPEGMQAYSAALEKAFGFSLRQLSRPPSAERYWIAALRNLTDEHTGHAVVARGRTVAYDPVEEGRGRWGELLPSSFGDRLVDGFELVEV
jgi:hypothetical protein